mmetsp:Transcript_15532/g.47871  ORF Transcript_15532/g.47871 Transcript_15532/m.47871 type:complete len:867 (+) Transcript_15532:108-2708(+)
MSSRRVVTGSEDGTAKVWAFDERQVQCCEAVLTGGAAGDESWQGHGAGITSVSFAPSGAADDGLILTSAKDNGARIWQQDGRLKLVLPAEKAAAAAAEEPLRRSRSRLRAEPQEVDAGLLRGHSDYVNAAVWSRRDSDAGELVLTCSDDGTAVIWNAETGLRASTLHDASAGHSGPVVMATWSGHASLDLILTCSHDRSCILWDAQCGTASRTLPLPQQEGHREAVWSARFSPDDALVLSTSKDGTAKVWDATTGQLQHTLDAGAHAVTVAVLATGEIVTGSQDRSLRVFMGAECKHRVNEAHTDIIRAISTGSTHLITASNDNLLKMWSLDGCEMAQLTGHQSFVYGVAHSQDGQTILSSSDDCTLKFWSAGDLQCRQSIIHAGTVWQAASLPNGDVVSCCADTVVRVWSSDPSRMAPQAERETQREMAEQAALQAASKGSSSQPMENAADISQMATAVGKKNGEIRCFKDGAVVFAFSWNAGARTWDKIGEVVGQEAEKKHYEGDNVFPRGDYDFVFDVDMGPAQGMRRLPYNKGQNPMEVAESFCSREQIHKGNIEQIRQFIIQNGGGGGGGEGAAASAPAKPPEPESTVFPVMTTVAFKDGKFDPLLGKILEFNGLVDASLQMDPVEVGLLKDAVGKLKSNIMSCEFRGCEKEVIHVKLKEWPSDRLFPVIDLWRLFLVHPQSADYFKGSDRGTPFITQVVGLLSSDPSGPLGLCSARYLANLFIYQTNKYAVFDKRDFVLKALEPVLSSSTNKHTKVACTSLLLNIAIVLHESSPPPKAWDAASGAHVARLALAFLAKAGPDDGDAQQRAALAIGTLLPQDRKSGGAVARQCLDAGLPAKLPALEGKVAAKALAELRKLLA